MDKLGLVTVLYNSESVLEGFFNSLSKQNFQNYWLYIIDNSENNDSYAEAEKQIRIHCLQNITLIKNEKNEGVAKANNQGIELALNKECDYVLLLNNDIEFDNLNLFKDLVGIADRQNENIVVPLIYYYNTNLIWCAGGYIRKWIGTTVHAGEKKTLSPKFDKASYTNYAPTCFMLIKSDVFKKIGLMDEKYFVYYDDTDFVWRFNSAGFRIFYTPELVVTHKVSTSTGGNNSAFSIYYYNRNYLLFILKNLPLIHKVFAILYYFTSRVIKWLLYDRNRKKALLNGIVSGCKLIRNRKK